MGNCSGVAAAGPSPHRITHEPIMHGGVHQVELRRLSQRARERVLVHVCHGFEQGKVDSRHGRSAHHLTLQGPNIRQQLAGELIVQRHAREVHGRRHVRGGAGTIVGGVLRGVRRVASDGVSHGVSHMALVIHQVAGSLPVIRDRGSS